MDILFFNPLILQEEPETSSPLCCLRHFEEIVQERVLSVWDQKHSREAVPSMCAGPSPARDCSWAPVTLEISCSSTTHVLCPSSPQELDSSIFLCQRSGNKQYTDTCTLRNCSITEQELKPLTIVLPTLTPFIVQWEQKDVTEICRLSEVISQAVFCYSHPLFSFLLRKLI